MTHAIQGVYSAAATPVTADGDPIPTLFAEHCKALINEGCHGIAMMGTTGEANSLGLSQRLALIESTIDLGVPANALLPGTSAPSVQDAVTLTAAAVDAGVKGVLLMPPFYYKNASDEGLYRFYSRVIEKVADDRLRVVLYHIPQMSMAPVSHDLIDRLMTAFPDIVCGVKDSSGVLENMLTMCERFPNLGVLVGADPLMHKVLKVGGAGCITGASNLRADALRTIWDHWQEPDKSEQVAKAQAQIEVWRELVTRFASLPSVKAMVAKRRGDDAWLPMLPPLIELPESERQELWAEMDKLGG